MTSSAETPAAELTPPIPSSVRGPIGIRGFLLFFTVGQIAAVLFGLTQVPALLEGFTADAWALGNSSPVYRPMVIIEAIAQLATIGCGAVGLWLIFRKDARAPRFYRVFLAAVVGYGLIELSGMYLVYSDLLELAVQAGQPTQELEGLQQEANTTAVRGIAYSFIWLAYWHNSKRVSNTFVRTPRAGPIRSSA